MHSELSNNHSLNNIDYILVFFLHLEIYTNQDEKESVIINTKGSNLILILLRNKKNVVLSTRVANKGNNKITELRTILQRESPNS